MKSLLLWCSEDNSPPPEDFTVYWSQYISEQERGAGNVSLPEVINNDVSFWKSRYLSWLNQVGQMPCRNKTVVDALLIRPGLSYWWMTIPSEFSFSPTTIAYATMRLWALAQIADANFVQEVRVAGADTALQGVLTNWGDQTGRQITFIHEKVRNKDKSQVEGISARAKKRLPFLIVGLGHLVRQYHLYFTLHRNTHFYKNAPNSTMTIVDNLAHCNIDAARRGDYEPHYWGPLTQVLEDSTLVINWIHIDLRTTEVPTVEEAKKVLTELNGGHKSARHFLLQDFLNVKVAFKAIVVYFRIRKISRKVASHIQWFDSTSQVDVTAIVANDLASDFRGYGAARNALWLCLFEAVIKSLPRQGKGLYLMENQSFELALVNAWNGHSKGPIYGFAHGLVREWDLRYALGQTRVPEDEAQNRPRPSLIAVNGPLAEQSMRANGVHPEHLVAVEALRFESKSTAIKRPKSLRVDGSAPLRILMLGEYAAATTQRQMVALKGLTRLLPKNTVLTFRPHPGGTVRPESLPEGVRLSQETKLSLDLDSCDVVIASNVSNASLDAYMHGLPVLIHGNGEVLNGTHLSAEADVRMLASVTDIVIAISEIVDLNRSSRVAPESVFNLDPDLPRWRQLLGLPRVNPIPNPTGNAK